MAANFALPITVNGVPSGVQPTGFGAPTSMSMGQPTFSTGGVPGTTPGPTFTAQRSTRHQARFQVQPQCTVSFVPAYQSLTGTPYLIVCVVTDKRHIV